MLWLALVLACNLPAGESGTEADSEPNDSGGTDDSPDPEDSGDDSPVPDDSGDDSGGGDTDPVASAACGSLPEPTGTIIEVGPEDAGSLDEIVGDAPAGATILLADGQYDLSSSLWITADALTLRSASGDRDAVILDGDHAIGEIVNIGASDVTVADITIREATWHPIHVYPFDGDDVTGVLIYNVAIYDPGQQAIKVNTDNQGDPSFFVDDLEIACSTLELTDAGRAKVPTINGGECYTGGIDAHATDNLYVHHNTIRGFWCPGGNDYPSEHAIHVWNGGRDSVIEANLMFDNARGVGLGLGDGTWGVARVWSAPECPNATNPFGHVGGVVRNNVVAVSDERVFDSTFGFDTGIGAEQVCGASLLHNTVFSTEAPESSSIEYRYSDTRVTVSNNLTSAAIRQRDGAVAELDGNADDATAADFVDAEGGDLHLAAGSDAIDAGVELGGECDIDVDDATRDGSPDQGADEFGD